MIRAAIDRVKAMLGQGPSAQASGSPTSDGDGEAGARWEKGGGKRVKWKRRAPARGLVTEAPVERSCPKCGAAMLEEWGANCPACRPRIAVAKTMALTMADLTASAPMVLGWLVVLQSPAGKRGQLIELSERVTVLSRDEGPRAPGTRWCAFEDSYMSSGHATIRRPPVGTPDSAFSIEERSGPAGPSSNGIYVNSRRLDPGKSSELSDGDVVRLGTTEFQFKSLWLPPGEAVR